MKLPFQPLELSMPIHIFFHINFYYTTLFAICKIIYFNLDILYNTATNLYNKNQEGCVKTMFRIKWKSVIKLAAIVLAVYLCIHYWGNISALISKVISAAMPIAIGLTVAYTLNILMSFYERHYFTKSKKKLAAKTRRPVCLAGALITLLGIVALVIGLIAPQLAKCIMMLIDEVPAAIERVVPKLKEIGIVPDDIIQKLTNIDWQSRIGDIFSAVSTGLGGAVNIAFTAVSSVFSGVTNFVIGIIFALYLLIEKDKLIAQFKRLINRFVPENKVTKINYVWAELSDCFHDFIVGQCTEAVILGVLCMLGMLILQIPYAPMIGALMGFTALIPIVGGLIGAGIGAFLILMESPVKALIFVIFVIILQQIEGNLIYPKVVGKSLGLPGIWVLAAVTIGGGVMGIGGMLIGVPLAAAAYRLLKAYINMPDEKAPQPVETQE